MLQIAIDTINSTIDTINNTIDTINNTFDTINSTIDTINNTIIIKIVSAGTQCHETNDNWFQQRRERECTKKGGVSG